MAKCVDENPIAIFGEAKSQIAMSRIPSELSDIDRKIEYVEKNLDQVKDLLGLKSDPILEYVLAIPPNFAVEVSKNIRQSDRKIIIWQADRTNYKVSLCRPNDDQYEGRIHHDKKLNQELGGDGLYSALNVYGVFPQSHMFSKVNLLIRSRNLGQDPHLVLTQILRQRVDSYLPTLDSREKKTLVDEIVDEGLRIEFIEKHESLAGAFIIRSKSRQEETLGSELLKCWIETRLTDTMIKDFIQARKELQEHYLELDRANPPITSYFDTPS